MYKNAPFTFYIFSKVSTIALPVTVAENGFCPVIIRPSTSTLHPQFLTHVNFAPFAFNSDSTKNENGPDKCPDAISSSLVKLVTVFPSIKCLPSLNLTLINPAGP